MTRDALTLHALNQVRKTVACRVKIWIVNLTNVARKHNLGALAHSTDNGLHLMRRKILRLVDNNKLVRNTAAADIGQRLHD